jgi:chromate transporter
MGTFAYGGVYSMLALLEKELVQRKKWMTHESFSEAFTIGQIIPGAPIVNTGIFIGYHFGKFPGAVITVTAQTLPALIKIILLATIYLKYHDLPAVQAAMKGIGAGVVALIFSVVIQMGKKMERNIVPALLFSGAVLWVIAAGGNPIYPLIASGAAGIWLLKNKELK